VNGSYLLHPFAVLEVEAVTGNAVKLVEVELLEPARNAEVAGERPGVTGKGGVGRCCMRQRSVVACVSS
jgi:hypothetical protein